MLVIFCLGHPKSYNIKHKHENNKITQHKLDNIYDRSLCSGIIALRSLRLQANQASSPFLDLSSLTFQRIQKDIDKHS